MHYWRRDPECSVYVLLIALFVAAVRMAVRLLIRFGVVKPENEKGFFDRLAIGVLVIVVILILLDEGNVI